MHGANVVAAVAVVATTFADLTLAGGTATIIGGALSVSGLVKKAERGQEYTARQIATSLTAHLGDNQMTEDRTKILAQMLATYVPSDQDLAAGSMNAKNIAAIMRDRISAQAIDPEYKTPVALANYEKTLTAMLNPVLKPTSTAEAMLQELLARTEQPREAQRLRDAGITEAAILTLAGRIASDTNDLNQAWRSLHSAIETTIEQKQRLEPKPADYTRQFNELVTELKRRSNEPYEVQKVRAEARVAVDAKAYDEARIKLTKVAAMTRNTAEKANLDFARSLAALGALAFTEEDFSEARLQYFEAMNVMGLEHDRRSHYIKSYRIASNAWISRNLKYAEGRGVRDEMVAAGVSPNEVTYNTLINLAPTYAEGRGVLDEMLAAGVSPDEITLTTLLKVGAKFNEGCELAVFAREAPRMWFTGRGFYTALFARPIDHISAKELLAKYAELPFSFDTSLENPIRQYRRTRQQDQALDICVRFPYLPAAEKFFRERAEYCLSALSEMIVGGEENVDVHYAAGVAAQLNRRWDQAEERLKIAHEIATDPTRAEDIRSRLSMITDQRA